MNISASALTAQDLEWMSYENIANAEVTHSKWSTYRRRMVVMVKDKQNHLHNI